MIDAIGRFAPAVFAAVFTVAAAAAEPSLPQAPDMQKMHERMMKMEGEGGAHDARPPAGAIPTMPGQDAFGTIQEIVRILEGDPATDWSKVDLEALRRHLVDMNEVTLYAVPVAKSVDNGVEITVTGTGRTIGSIQRMVGANAHEIDGLNGWSARSERIPHGARLAVTAADAKEVAHLRGLGFIGIMVEGSHHLRHHLAIARGEAVHAH